MSRRELLVGTGRVGVAQRDTVAPCAPMATVLNLQRHIGNRAVATIVSDRPAIVNTLARSIGRAPRSPSGSVLQAHGHADAAQLHASRLRDAVQQRRLAGATQVARVPVRERAAQHRVQRAGGWLDSVFESAARVGQVASQAIAQAAEGSAAHGAWTDSDGDSADTEGSWTEEQEALGMPGREQDEALHEAAEMLACPPQLAPSDPIPPGWKAYHGDSRVFHCGFRGILDERPPGLAPMNECFYDHGGELVDAEHAYAACGGTPDQFDSTSDPFFHFLLDSGGIVHAGWPAYWESKRYAREHGQ